MCMRTRIYMSDVQVSSRPGAAPQEVANLGPGDFFGETGLLEYLEEIIGSNVFVAPIAKASADYDGSEEGRTQAKNRMRAAEKAREGLRGSRDELIAFQQAQVDVARRQNLLWHALRQRRVDEALGAEAEVFRAHKAVLAAASPQFEQWLRRANPGAALPLSGSDDTGGGDAHVASGAHDASPPPPLVCCDFDVAGANPIGGGGSTPVALLELPTGGGGGVGVTPRALRTALQWLCVRMG